MTKPKRRTPTIPSAPAAGTGNTAPEIQIRLRFLEPTQKPTLFAAPRSKLCPWNPARAAPDLSAVPARDRHAALTRWLDQNYPRDIVIPRVHLKEWLVCPFGHRGAYLATIVACTEPDMRATGNRYKGRIVKRSRCQVLCGWNYANAVNAAREKLWQENDGPVFEDGLEVPPATGGRLEMFTPKERTWGHRWFDGGKATPLVVHTPRDQETPSFYLETRVLKALETQYLCDRNPIDKKLLEPWLRESRSNAAHQGLTEETEVVLRDYRLDSIETFSYAGRTLFVA